MDTPARFAICNMILSPDAGRRATAPSQLGFHQVLELNETAVLLLLKPGLTRVAETMTKFICYQEFGDGDIKRIHIYFPGLQNY
ncbi:uncharacterized protein ACBT57_004763 [Dama dama]